MANTRELNPNEMGKVTGGVNRVVNTGVEGLDAALRSGPGKGYSQIGHISNKSVVDTVTDQLVYDAVSGRNYVEVRFGNKTGWIAASIIGLPR